MLVAKTETNTENDPFGRIDADGVYHAPSQPCKLKVRATSDEDPNAFAEVTVVVLPRRGNDSPTFLARNSDGRLSVLPNLFTVSYSE